MDKDAYDKLLIQNITKTYRKAETKQYNDINQEAKDIAKNFEIADRVECLAKSNSFITLKDHKSNFTASPKCRLINPAKSEIGKISKLFLENINEKVRKASSVNQWRDTSTVINWYKKIKNKRTILYKARTKKSSLQSPFARQTFPE